MNVAVQIEGRLPESIEEAAYYVVSEGLTNVEMQRGDTSGGVGTLRVCVRDDGCGGADLTRGSGLVGLKDRVEALGGRFSMQSPGGGGTRLDAPLRYSPASDGSA